MELASFVSSAQLFDKSEVERARLLAYYYLRQDDVEEFNAGQMCGWFTDLSLARPNPTRLKARLTSANGFVRGSAKGTYRLHAKTVLELDNLHSGGFGTRDVVVSAGSVIPDLLLTGAPGYVTRLANQINASYEHAIFDGCAVLMRRLVEVLLIQTYEKLDIAASIQDGNGEYMQLGKIIDNAIGNSVLKLSRSSRKHIGTYRTLGNFSAHKLYYSCSRPDIADTLVEYRALIQELLSKGGLVT